MSLQTEANSLSKRTGQSKLDLLLIVLISLLLMSPILLGSAIYMLHIISLQPDEELLERFENLKAKYESYVENESYGILINYELPIFMQRLWVIDLKNNKVVLNSCVSHARRSGWIFPSDFSNKPETFKSCAGSFVTGASYHGNYGQGMRLKGLEKGVNKNARQRAIVFHPARGMTWSGGCFMTPKEINDEIIELTEGGAFLYVYASET